MPTWAANTRWKINIFNLIALEHLLLDNCFKGIGYFEAAIVLSSAARTNYGTGILVGSKFPLKFGHFDKEKRLQHMKLIFIKCLTAMFQAKVKLVVRIFVHSVEKNLLEFILIEYCFLSNTISTPCELKTCR